MSTTTAFRSPAKTAATREREPLRLRKRIGSTTYTAIAFFSDRTSETLEDKILRLARNDGLGGQPEAPKDADPKRTGRAPERSTEK